MHTEMEEMAAFKTEPVRKHTRSDGERTRKAILDLAVDLASLDGLEQLSIGRLASETGMSKSGLFAHFGSKTALQLAAIEQARLRYVERVVKPALNAKKGLARLESLCDAMLDYLDKRVFPGGCFFAKTRAEFNGRPGQVHEQLLIHKAWIRDLLATLAQDAISHRELSAKTDAEVLSFELESFWDAPNWVLHDKSGPRDMNLSCDAMVRTLKAAGAKSLPRLNRRLASGKNGRANNRNVQNMIAPTVK